MKTRPELYIFVSGLLAALPLLAATYTFTDINPFSSVDTSARGINEDGDVVGDFATAADVAGTSFHGFLLHRGKFSKIDFPNSFDTDANGINNEGVIVGTYAEKLTNGARGPDHGYVLDEKEYHKLPDPPAAYKSPGFNALNDEGDIVGVFTPTTGSNNAKGFLLKESKYTVLDCKEDQTKANGINDDGDIVGECDEFASTFGIRHHGFLLRKGKFTLFDFPGAICDGTLATGINNDGDIVGIYNVGPGCPELGFVVKDFPEHPHWTTVSRPGAAISKLTGISDEGKLVGSSSLFVAGVGTGFTAQKSEHED